MDQHSIDMLSESNVGIVAAGKRPAPKLRPRARVASQPVFGGRARIKIKPHSTRGLHGRVGGVRCPPSLAPSSGANRAVAECVTARGGLCAAAAALACYFSKSTDLMEQHTVKMPWVERR